MSCHFSFCPSASPPFLCRMKVNATLQHGILVLLYHILSKPAIKITVLAWKEKIKELDAQLTPEIKEANHAIAIVENMKKEQEQLEQELETLRKETDSKRKELSSITDTLTAESFGLYEPRYKFASALDYKEELAKTRALQKTLIKDNRAVTGNMLWQVNGNASKGKKKW